MKNKVQNQKQNDKQQAMPEETKYKLDDMNHDMKEIPYYYEQDR